MTPKLIPLDMSHSNKHEHPDIQENKQYLCLIGGKYYAGSFSREWYGWNFDGWYTDLQFDAPGYNNSKWTQIWEIKRR